MFTGIIEETGTIAVAESRDGGIDFTIRAGLVLDGLRIGDSVAVDGVCLTATSADGDSFTVHAVGSTLERTTLGILTPGRRVNLERALALGERLGGHLVQGHVDGVGEVVAIDYRDDYVLIDFTVPLAVDEITIPLGSITLNGISLTVNALPSPGLAQVSIIPHTREVTSIGELEVGSSVNLEGDLLGKYIRRLVEHRGTVAPGGNRDRTESVHVAPPEG